MLRPKYDGDFIIIYVHAIHMPIFIYLLDLNWLKSNFSPQFLAAPMPNHR